MSAMTDIGADPATGPRKAYIDLLTNQARSLTNDALVAHARFEAQIGNVHDELAILIEEIAHRLARQQAQYRAGRLELTESELLRHWCPE